MYSLGFFSTLVSAEQRAEYQKGSWEAANYKMKIENKVAKKIENSIQGSKNTMKMKYMFAKSNKRRKKHINIV